MNALLFLFCCIHFAMTNKKHQPNVKFNYDKTMFVAHRGLTSQHLENSLKALTAAFEAGADGVEFDVQLSSDLVPMVFHDRELKRLTGIDKNIDDLMLADLTLLKQHSERYQKTYPISTLEELLKAMPAGKLINVELKETTAMRGRKGIDEVLKVLNPFKKRLNMVISSFEPRILAMVHEADPDYSLGFLIDKEDTLLAYLRAYDVVNKVDYLHPHIDLVTEPVSHYAKSRGIKLITWGHKKLGEESVFLADNHMALISDVTEDLIKKYI
jgi:glycerophosphoryl diester phosphodiesterase